MHLVLLVCGAVILTSGMAQAQGVKDPANFGAVANSKPQSAPEPSRPTTVRNIPTNMLPSGAAIQRGYKDGKTNYYLR